MAETGVKITPLLFVGLGAAIAFRCNALNVGFEGQLVMGAIAATGIGLSLTNVPAALLIPLIIAAGFLAGAGWAGLAGWLKARFGATEIVTTMMMNFIAAFFVSYLVFGPWSSPGGLSITPPICQSARLPKIIPGTRLHAGFLIALLCVFLTYEFLWKSVSGYKIRVVGSSPNAARYAGIDVTKNMMIAMCISGGLAGLAGVGEVSGVHHFLTGGISAGYGFSGIMVGLVGGLHPVGTFLAAILFGTLYVGGEAMKRALELPYALVLTIQALVLIFVLLSEILTRYKIILKHKGD
jgi:simple sugar transport system permease protein